jgi:hypothetical protein
MVHGNRSGSEFRGQLKDRPHECASGRSSVEGAQVRLGLVPTPSREDS